MNTSLAIDSSKLARPSSRPTERPRSRSKFLSAFGAVGGTSALGALGGTFGCEETGMSEGGFTLGVGVDGSADVSAVEVGGCRDCDGCFGFSTRGIVGVGVLGGCIDVGETFGRSLCVELRASGDAFVTEGVFGVGMSGVTRFFAGASGISGVMVPN